MAGSFAYGHTPGMDPVMKEFWDANSDWRPIHHESDPLPVCPHCKRDIQVGDTVHQWDGVLWHTKPCPTEG